MKKNRNGERLLKGERKRVDGRYEFRYRDSLGKQKSVYANSLVELRQKKEELSDMRRKGIDIDKPYISLDDQYNRWCNTKRGIKANTFANYKYMYRRYVYGKFGKNKIRDIKRNQIKQFYIQLNEKEHLQVNTIDTIHNVIRQVFESAIDDDIILYNPSNEALKELKRSVKSSKITEALTVEEERIFFDFLSTDLTYRRWYTIFRFLAVTGLRAGEFAALQKEDINYENRTINIDKTIAPYSTEIKGKMRTVYEIHSPKTRAGTRVIPMTNEIEYLLHEEEKYQTYADLSCKEKVGIYDNFFFLTKDGTVYRDCTLNRALKRIVEACNTERIVKLGEDAVLLPPVHCHMLRHTFNTRMKSCGTVVEDRMRLMGQSNFDVNIGIYTHTEFDELRAMMLKYEEEFGSNI